MGSTKAGGILLTVLFAFFVFSSLPWSPSECRAASGDNAIRIISPAADDVITDFAALVKGELNVPSGTEVRVTINGTVALVDRGKFATMIPMNFPSPTTNLTATMTDSLGTTLSSHSIPITAKVPDSEPVLSFRAFPALRMAPLSVRFSMTSLKEIELVELDLDGNGRTDWYGATLNYQEFSLREPGLYYPTVKVIDVEGNVHTDRALVQVLNPKELDVLLQAKWKSMKGALKLGDISEAVSYITISKRTGYQLVFEALTIPLANIDQILTDISFVQVQWHPG